MDPRIRRARGAGRGAAVRPRLGVCAPGTSARCGEAAATALSGLACITLGWLLVSAVPVRWLRWGVYAMAAIDADRRAPICSRAPTRCSAPPHRRRSAAPAGRPLRLRRMGFGDLFVAALVGCLLAIDRRTPTPSSRSRRRSGARLRPALLCRRHVAGDGAGRGGAGGGQPPQFSSAVAIPFFEVGQRVDRAAALVPAGCCPDLEVEVAGGGVAGVADDADRLAGADLIAGLSAARVRPGART